MSQPLLQRPNEFFDFMKPLWSSEESSSKTSKQSNDSKPSASSSPTNNNDILIVSYVLQSFTVFSMAMPFHRNGVKLVLIHLPFVVCTVPLVFLPSELLV